MSCIFVCSLRSIDVNWPMLVTLRISQTLPTLPDSTEKPGRCVRQQVANPMMVVDFSYSSNSAYFQKISETPSKLIVIYRQRKTIQVAINLEANIPGFAKKDFSAFVGVNCPNKIIDLQGPRNSLKFT